jgi:cytoskeletal protein RodZ
MSGKDNGAHAGLKIGHTLELTRKERGLSLHQVEQETKIRARYLRELERENFDVLPPVYVQGSLKTYANFLGLDGEALTRELRRRRPPENEPEAPPHIEPPKSDYFDRYLISVGGVAGAEDQEVTDDEEIAGATTVPANNHRLHLGSAAFLVLILVAVALGLTLPRDSQPVVSEVREPLISQAPSEVYRVGDEESRPVSQEDDESDNRQPEQQAGSPDGDTGDDGSALTGQDQGGYQSAIPSAPPAAETASAEPEATPTTDEPAPATTQPTPTASEAPVEDSQGVVDGARVEEPLGQDNEGPVMHVSVTKKNVTIGNTSSSGGTNTSNSCSRDRGHSLEIRQGKKGVKICLAGNAADKNNDRQRLP